MGVDRAQRFSAANPCPVCNGYDEAARGNGARCFGFLSDDGRYAHCSREEYAGALERNATSATYCHYLGSGTCRCGKEHSGPISAHTAANGKAETKRRANFEQPKDTVYFYRLPSDEAIYAAIRFGGKKPSYPAYKKDGVWWLGTPEDYSPIPYNLPGVMRAALEGKPVDIFEGESDVEVAKKLGLYATTNMMGAGKFMQELVPYFRGLDVRLNQDNDAPGKDHALDVAHKLFGTAKSIKVIPPFPGVPEGGDFKDWIAAGGTKEEYLRMVEEAGDLFKPDSNPVHGGSGLNRPFPVYKVRKIKELNEEGAGEGWFCPLFMRAGEITLFGGAAKESGKTTFYAHMLKCVHDGKPFMGMPTIKSGALVLTEQGPNILESTAKAGISDDDEIYFAFYKDLVNEDWNDLLEAAVTVCERLGVKILVVDTLTAFAELHGSDENLSGEIIARMKPVLSAARVYGLHVSILHHTGKDGELRGSSALNKDPDAIWVLGRPPGDHGPNVRALRGRGRHDAINTSFNVALEDAGYVLLGTNNQIEHAKAENKLLEEIPVGFENARRRTEVVPLVKEETGVGDGTVQRALEALVAQGVVKQQKPKAPGSPAVLWKPKPFKRPPGSDKDAPGGAESNKTPANEGKTDDEHLFKPNPKGIGEEHGLNESASDHHAYVHTEARAEKCLRWAKEVPEVAIDTETYGRLKRDGLLYTKGTIRLIQLHHGDTTWFIDCDAVEDGLVAAILKELENKPKYFHNALFDVPRLHRQFGVLLKENVHDTMIASRVARAGEWTTKNHKVVRIEHSLEECLKRELGITISKDRKLKWDTQLTREHLEYARDDVVLLKALYETLLKVLKERRVEERYAVIGSTLPVFIDAAVRGVPLDAQRLETALEEIEKEKEHLKSRLDELAPEHPEGLPWVWGNTDKNISPEGKGRAGALRALSLVGVSLKDLQDQTLLDHLEDHELVDVLYNYRKKASTYSRYAKWIKDFYEDGRLYPQPKVAGAVTGRVLYSDPNAQGIDKKKTDKFRKCIRAEENMAIVHGDFAQQELRIAAYFSRDKNMLDAFANGDDIYLQTAAKLVGKPVDRDHPARDAAKRATLGFLYGLGTERYRQNVYKDTGEKLSQAQSKKDLAAFRAAFPEFFKWQQSYGAKEEWVTRSMLGWRRVVAPDQDGKPKYTDRLNGPIQSTAGDILYLTLKKLAADPRPATHFLLSVHDELVLECPKEDARGVAAWLKAKMGEAMEEILGRELGGPECAEVGYGPSWGECVELEEVFQQHKE